MTERTSETERTSDRLTAKQARNKVAECRSMARQMKNAEHKTMLEHMAETWEGIAHTLENGR